MSIDLHVHSNFSDGTESPQEIIDKAADIGLKAISITDHETIESYSNITNYTIETIQGVEVSAKWDKSDEKNDKLLKIDLKEPFLPRRGRVNCSLNDDNTWRWLGIQFSIEQN